MSRGFEQSTYGNRAIVATCTKQDSTRQQQRHEQRQSGHPHQVEALSSKYCNDSPQASPRCTPASTGSPAPVPPPPGACTAASRCPNDNDFGPDLMLPTTWPEVPLPLTDTPAPGTTPAKALMWASAMPEGVRASDPPLPIPINPPPPDARLPPRLPSPSPTPQFPPNEGTDEEVYEGAEETVGDAGTGGPPKNVSHSSWSHSSEAMASCREIVVCQHLVRNYILSGPAIFRSVAQYPLYLSGLTLVAALHSTTPYAQNKR